MPGTEKHPVKGTGRDVSQRIQIVDEHQGAFREMARKWVDTAELYKGNERHMCPQNTYPTR
jgi:hypothetical protein